MNRDLPVRASRRDGASLWCCARRIDMSTMERAIAIAAEAHAGQVDKAGAPYVLHQLRMMLRMASNDERIVAVLHDVCGIVPAGRWSDCAARAFPSTSSRRCGR